VEGVGEVGTESVLKKRWKMSENTKGESQLEFDFEKAVRHICKGMTDQPRWEKFYGMGMTHESVMVHTLKQTMQALFMQAIEMRHGNPYGLHFERLVYAPPTHDMPEGHETYEDINYHDKRKNPQLRLEYKRREKEIFLEMMENMFGKEDMHLIPVPLDMDPDAPMVDRIYWQALEHISHSLYILEDLTLGTVTDQEQVALFERDVAFEHVAWLIQYAYHFPSVEYMLRKQILPKWRMYKENKEKGEKK